MSEADRKEHLRRLYLGIPPKKAKIVSKNGKIEVSADLKKVQGKINQTKSAKTHRTTKWKKKNSQNNVKTKTKRLDRGTGPLKALPGEKEKNDEKKAPPKKASPKKPPPKKKVNKKTHLNHVLITYESRLNL